ncbi:MAG: hypothetical protein RIQ60_170 [Pseudomonadota bacterium]|jgi:folate-binding protein YgfZ
MSTDLEHIATSRIGRGGALHLPHWGVIRAGGADAASFLHGQLSNDINHLGDQQARLAAFCTAQGRMLASFVVARAVADTSASAAPATPATATPAPSAPGGPGAAAAALPPDTLWLACRSDVLPATLKRLSMFVLRAKARLSDAGDALAVLGLLGPSATSWLAAQGIVLGGAWQAGRCVGGRVLRLPDAPGAPRWMWMGPTSAAEAVLAALPADAGLDRDAWDALEIRAGVVPVQAATSGLFVPQMLNFELVGGVDFKKGCYPGQEVVARSHYLGKLKRRGVLLGVAAGEPAPLAGAEVWWSGDTAQPAGQVAQAAPVGNGGAALLLAELKLAALGAAPDGGPSTLHLGSAHGPLLQRLPLPYALPQEDQAPA